MERVEIRMTAAANYYARMWGQPVPEMTPKFAEIIITRWRGNVRQGIVAIPAGASRNHRQPVDERTRHFDFGGSAIDVRPNEVAIGKEVYKGPGE